MVDYSEALLSIATSMKEIHKLLQAGKREEASQYLRIVERTAGDLSHWLLTK